MRRPHRQWLVIAEVYLIACQSFFSQQTHPVTHTHTRAHARTRIHTSIISKLESQTSSRRIELHSFWPHASLFTGVNNPGDESSSSCCHHSWSSVLIDFHLLRLSQSSTPPTPNTYTHHFEFVFYYQINGIPFPCVYPTGIYQTICSFMGIIIKRSRRIHALLSLYIYIYIYI